MQLYGVNWLLVPRAANLDIPQLFSILVFIDVTLVLYGKEGEC